MLLPMMIVTEKDTGIEVDLKKMLMIMTTMIVTAI
jgi:hypothetical protein